MINYQLQEEEENMDAYTIFVYGIRSPYTKESYFRRLRIFFDAIDLGKGKTFEERCNSFVHKVRMDSNWAFGNIHAKNKVKHKNIAHGKRLWMRNRGTKSRKPS